MSQCQTIRYAVNIVFCRAKITGGTGDEHKIDQSVPLPPLLSWWMADISSSISSPFFSLLHDSVIKINLICPIDIIDFVCYSVESISHRHIVNTQHGFSGGRAMKAAVFLVCCLFSTHSLASFSVSSSLSSIIIEML